MSHRLRPRRHAHASSCAMKNPRWPFEFTPLPDVCYIVIPAGHSSRRNINLPQRRARAAAAGLHMTPDWGWSRRTAIGRRRRFGRNLWRRRASRGEQGPRRPGGPYRAPLNIASAPECGMLKLDAPRADASRLALARFCQSDRGDRSWIIGTIWLLRRPCCGLLQR